ncbi:C-reactive protein-like [Clinocottus analis]|uniref:C-reactive protein-like n=1 Tax=Clinocottus analis TaxID=304258 RepID=UPI0035C1FC77
MAFILLLVMLTACAAAPEDLCGQMLVFPEQTSKANVVLTTLEDNFSAATVCFRSITDLRRAHALFSVATSSEDNAFLIFKTSKTNEIEFYVGGKLVKFGEQDYKLNEWQSICATWDSETGLVQLWLDGKPSIMKYIGGSKIEKFTALLGQDQDSLGGGFSSSQSFVGMISEVQMWNYTRSGCDIERYMSEQNYLPGNLINWRSLEYKLTGRVLLNDAQKSCPKRKPYGKGY